MKQIFYKLAKNVGFWCLGYVFSYIDKDDNGELSEQEIKDVVKKLQTLAKQIKR
jgi:hypothetical protein